MGAKAVMFCFTAGMAAGAYLGILFAPSKGKGAEAGDKMLKMKDDYIEDLKVKVDNFLDGISDKLEKVKSTVNDLADQAQSRLKDVKMEPQKDKELEPEI